MRTVLRPAWPAGTVQKNGATGFYNPQQDLQEVFYIGANQHVYEAYWSNGWIVEDVTGGSNLAAPSPTSITSFWNPQQNLQEVFYVGANQHVYEAYWSNGWIVEDVTGSNYLAAPSGGITSFWNPQQNLQEVFWVGANQHVNEAYWSNGWLLEDVTGSNYLAAPSGGIHLQPWICQFHGADCESIRELQRCKREYRSEGRSYATAASLISAGTSAAASHIGFGDKLQ